jgi:HEAT repeat protein
MRWLTKLAQIRENERSLALYYVLLFVLLGAGLAIGKGSMDALFLKRYGVQYLPIMYAVLSVVMATVSLGYAAFVDRIAPERSFTVILGIIAVLVAGSWVLISFTNTEWIFPAYFLIYELASEILLLHGKHYLGQNMDTLQLQRLSPPIFAGAQVGMGVGGVFLGLAGPTMGIGNILLVWTALAAAGAVLIIRRHRRIGISPYFTPGHKGRGGLRKSVEQITQGLKLFRTAELLRASSYALLFMVIAFFILNYAINRVFTETFPTEERLGSFIGWLTAVMSTGALLIQVFLTSKLLRRFGVKRINLIFPAGMVFSFSALLFAFALPAAIIGSFAKSVLFPAIRKPARAVFLHALPHAHAGRVGALSMGLVLPLALLSSSGLLILTQSNYDTSHFLLGGLVASLLYFYFKLRVNKAYSSALLSTLRHQLFLPHRYVQNLLHEGNDEVREELARGVASPDETVSLAYARMLTEASPERATQVIAERLSTASYPMRDRLLRLLVSSRLPIPVTLRHTLADADPHLKVTILEAMFDARDEHARSHVADCLGSDNPRLAAIGVFGVHCYELTDMLPQARRVWEKLLSSSREVENIAGLELLARIPEPWALPQLRHLAQQPSLRVRQAALHAICRFPAGSLSGFATLLRDLFENPDPELRTLCVTGFRVLDPEQRNELCLRALEDRHPAVRDAALASLEEAMGTERATEILTRWIVENRGFPRAQEAALTAMARFPAPRDIFERIAEAKIRDATSIASALRVLQREHAVQTRDSSASALLEIALEERLKQVIDLSLMAIERLEDPAAVATVRAGLQSPDRRHFADACQAMSNLGCKALAAQLVALLDKVEEDHERPKSGGAAFLDTQEVLAWGSQHPDSWLRECALWGAAVPMTSQA